MANKTLNVGISTTSVDIIDTGNIIIKGGSGDAATPDFSTVSSCLFKEMTLSQYNALSSAEKNNPNILYFVIDG